VVDHISHEDRPDLLRQEGVSFQGIEAVHPVPRPRLREAKKNRVLKLYDGDFGHPHPRNCRWMTDANGRPLRTVARALLARFGC
jgi:hypothetical protein